MGLIDGTITPAMMENGRFKDHDVLALIQRCKIELPDEFSAIAPAVRCCRLTARLKNGVTIVVEERRSLEDDAADPGWNYAVEKFRGLTRDLLDASAGERLIDAVHTLDTAPSVAALIAATGLNK